MSNFRIFVFCVSTCLTGCTDSTAIHDGVKQSLKDPDSAKFGEITETTGPMGKYACVTVNARNSFGGYTGDFQMAMIWDKEYGWVMLNELDKQTHSECVTLMTKVANTPEAHK